ncbi:MAG: hypothetical protein PHD43_19095 [Methylococcales bacterium]|nr:hypothetical protein [Methylococcales bacterium]
MTLEAEHNAEKLQLHSAQAPATQAKSASKPEPETAPETETDVQAVDVNSLELVRPGRWRKNILVCGRCVR